EKCPGIAADRLLKDGDRVENFEVIHTPGHSRGSICLYDREDESHPLISGDTVFADGGFGRIDLAGGDESAMRSSLNRLSEIDAGDIFPGHGRVVYRNGKKHIADSLGSFNHMYP
ncbi:MAG: MBL fold metallo-hydrolase, partial [Methanomicrobium sp.]|nr:MBL fold metallo-hydrolase [Methanomicrobium sp.]